MDEHSGMLLCMSFQIISMFYKKDLLCVCVFSAGQLVSDWCDSISCLDLKNLTDTSLRKLLIP